MFARAFQQLGRSLDAQERFMQGVEEAKPKDTARPARLLAEFYMSPAYTGGDKVQKATPLINQILKEVADGELDPNDKHATWARSAAAKIYAASRQYQDLRAAQKLLASNSTDGRLSKTDQMLMASILLSRPEPGFAIKGNCSSRDSQKEESLTAQAEIQLGQLYASLGEWRKCREQMTDTTTRYPEVPAVRQAYIEMLLERGTQNDVNAAVRQLKRLLELAPSEVKTRVLAARIAMKRGKKKQALSTLRGILPRNLQDIKEQQVPLVLSVAKQLTEFEDYDTAEQLYQLAASKGGDRSKLALAEFVGEHRDPGQAFDILKEMFSGVPSSDILRSAMTVLLSADADEIQPQVETMEKWLGRALREDPELVTLRILQAEVYDLKKEYQQAIDEYREILKLQDLKGLNRAIVLNNLAYLLALASDSKNDMQESIQFIGEAVDILGPQSEVLDTRGVIAIADKRYDDAIQDLELSLIDRPTASKYFHLAMALQLAGQNQEAAEAWQEAVELGLDRDSVNRLERERYDDLKNSLEGAGLVSANL